MWNIYLIKNTFKVLCLLGIILLLLSPVLILFAMGYDWGRWVNISYVILALIYFQLLNGRSKRMYVPSNRMVNE